MVNPSYQIQKVKGNYLNYRVNTNKICSKSSIYLFIVDKRNYTSEYRAKTNKKMLNFQVIIDYERTEER